MSRTLAERVARAMTLAAAITAAGTAMLADALAWRSTLAREDARLRGAAATLLHELDAEPASRAGAEADDEAAEVAPSGIALSLWSQGARVGGRVGEAPGPPGCASVAARRRCTVPSGAWTVVASSGLGPLREARRTSALASLVAVALASLAARLASRGVSARIIGPLSRLRASVSALRADAPDARALPPPARYEEVDALRDALADLVSRHADALAASRRFAADAAHELRTPLGTMRTELELAAETPGLNDEIADALGRVRATVEAITSLSERLLILASPVEGLALGRDAVALADVLAARVAALSPPRRARVTVDAPEDLIVRGDAVLLGALVDNALDNALKFSDGAVLVRVLDVAGRVVLRVCDEGPGLTAEERVRVFAPFYRSAAARAGAARGHGVGLALIAHIARAHGATARFDDVPRGAALEVAFPGWHEAPPDA